MKQNRTRTALADAYMRLLNDYTIDRITVKMITDAVGCSRKTFYYYFTDVYVLTQYVFELRVQQFLDTNGNFETMREGFLTLAANLSNDRQAILNIYHGYGKEELERFTWETSDYYARQVITRYAQNMDIAPEDLEAIIRMYTDMMFGMLIDWINNAEVEWKGDFGTMDYNELFEEPAAKSANVWMYVAIAALVVIVALAAVLLGRKKPAETEETETSETAEVTTDETEKTETEEASETPAAPETETEAPAEAEGETKTEEDE